MFRSSFLALMLLSLLLSSPSYAVEELKILESVVKTGIHVQTGLSNYHARVETSRIEEMMARLTKGIPDDVEAPPTPVIYKFWQRDGKGIVYAESTGLTPFVDKMVRQISGNLSIELNEMLLPSDRAEQRSALAKQAKVKTNEVVLGNNAISQIEIKFNKPTDLNQAFYVSGMRLPQKQVTMLAFDIDAQLKTINEMKLATANGLQLAVEIRYIEVAGGTLPERFKITSPDGKIDDLFEVKFTEVDGFIVPASMLRTIRRPDIREDLEIVFKDYRINQPITADLQKMLNED